MPWTHPQHNKGVKSPTLASAHVGAPLTDSAIRRYALEGRYGREVQSFYEKRQKKQKRKPGVTLKKVIAQLQRALSD